MTSHQGDTQHDHSGHDAHHHHHHHHGHKHQHGQEHKHQHAQADQWSGDDYLKFPGLRELAKFSHDTSIYALQHAGVTEDEIKGLNVLEVGCGAGAVTQLYAKSFSSVHAIDVSPSMLATFSAELPTTDYPNVTHSQHTLSANSGVEFQSGKPVKSPTKSEPEREITLPRTQWDVAVINLVLHHVDDIEGFMNGLKDLVRPGGWVVFTEFTNLHHHRKETAEGSVNAPEHYHQEFTQDSISALLGHCGFTEVHTEVRGKMSIPRDANMYDVDCLIARGWKPE